MSATRILVTGGRILTLDPILGDLADGAVLIEDGEIVAIAPDAERFAHVDAEVVDTSGAIVLPGLVDSHRHTWMALLRAISADHSLPEFLGDTFYGIGSILGAATTSILLRGLRELHDHGLLRPGHLHIHCPALTDHEWRLLADTGARVSIAPETELQMGASRPGVATGVAAPAA
ncbi:hypothetical protein [Embleya sp. NPDC020886]|uniref:hypothetical protein n=1 Tax=Embleya sp. NPDC020886 TaxID=3363980 RepID=UPI0037B590C0